MEEIEALKQEIELIKARNKKVELDKSWETSLTRKVSIAAATYILISLVLYSLGNDKPLLNAVVPATAYLLSTTTLSLLKKIWTKLGNKKV